MLDRNDYLIFRPGDVDLARSPLRRSLNAKTHVLGAFNPGLTRLPSGNLLLMVRIAEALTEPVADGHAHAIRWTPTGYVLDRYPLADVTWTDPRQFNVRGGAYPLLALTSLSWLLPVELAPDGHRVVAVHYECAIEPEASYEEYGIEDARISKIFDVWYLTACAVSAERHCTTLRTSVDGVNFVLQGIVLDHQNKDMVLFEGKINGKFVALTRPLGEVYFACPPDSPYRGGAAIQLASSPDARYWKPFDHPGIRPRKDANLCAKLGGGCPPLRTDCGWLVIYHGVELCGPVGVYRSFWALLDLEDPSRILRLEDKSPLLEAEPELTRDIANLLYLPSSVAPLSRPSPRFQ